MAFAQWVCLSGLSHEAIAARIGCKQSAISHWVTGRRPIPPERVLRVAEATDWHVTPHQLRPDLYPHPDDGLPAERRIAEAAE